MSKAENLPTTIDSEPAAYSVEINPLFRGFRSVRVTEVDESLPYKPAKTVEVTQQDGSTQPADAATPYAIFHGRDGEKLTLSMAAAGHIHDLHIAGSEPGSLFDVESIEELLGVVAAHLPEGIGAQEGVTSFSIDTGRSMGMEGLAGLDELLHKGVISESDINTLATAKDDISALNLRASQEDKQAFVDSYNASDVAGNIQLAVVRGGVIVPSVAAPKQPTSELFMVFGPSPDGGKTLYTMAPGRHMPKMPDGKQHKLPDGSIDEQTFEQSSAAWLDTAMLLEQ